MDSWPYLVWGSVLPCSMPLAGEGRVHIPETLRTVSLG